MKKLNSIGVVIALLFLSISCTKDKNIPNSDIESLKTQLKQLNSTQVTENAAITDMSAPFISKIDQNKLSLLTKINRMMIPWEGPFYATGTLQVVALNQKILITNTESPLPTGYYICNIYALSKEVDLPAGALARVDANLMTKIGYSNWTTKEIGVKFAQGTGPTSNKFGMTTYSILPVTNIIGQSVNAPALPAGDLTGVQFAYSYVL